MNNKKVSVMDIILMVFLVVFGVGVGLFLGAGNFGGMVGALIPGAVAGLLVAIPFLRDRNWVMASVIVVSAVVGSVAMSQLSDSNSLKRFFREQKSLVIRAGSYKLGHSDKE